MRFYFNLLCKMAGVGMLTFLVYMAFKFGIPNIPLMVFYVFIGIYLMYADNFIAELKKRQSRWSAVKYYVGMAALWLPVTLINLGLLHHTVRGAKMPIPLWIILILAWLSVPVNAIFDKMENK